MIIDAHNHPGWLGFEAEKIVADMSRHRIDLTWLLTWEVPADEVDPEMYMKTFRPGETGMPFRDVLQAASKYPDRFIPGYCPDPRRPDAPDRLEAAVENYGVKVCGELKLRMMLDNPDALRIYDLCARLKLPVVVHLDYPIPLGKGRYPRSDYWYGGCIESFERALKTCPNTLFVGHGPGFWAHISGDSKHLESYYPEGPVRPGGQAPRLLRECPNLCADLSARSARNALSRDREFGKDFLLEFQDKLLFARDEPGDKLMRLLEEFPLPEEAQAKIFYRNALRLVPLPVS